jgi:hypothetical protein
MLVTFWICRGTIRGVEGRNGTSRPPATKRHRSVLAKSSKAQLAARDRLIRDAERETGVKVTQVEVDAVLAQLAAAR